MIFLLLVSTFNIDVAQFSLDSNQTFCEIYYSLPTEDLKFHEKEGKYSTDFLLFLKIEDINSENISVDTLRKVVNVSDTAGKEEISDIRQIILKSGRDYKIDLSIEDSEGNEYKVDTIIFSKKWGKDLLFSDLQISHTLIPTDEENRFVKSGYKLLPFPRRDFDLNRYLLTSYCELYGLEGDSVLITSIIYSDSYGSDTILSEYYRITSDKMAIPMISNILGYASGRYNIKFIANIEDVKAITEKTFSIKEIERIARPEIPDSILDYASFINYISTSDELTEFNRLSPEGKKMFLLKFWSRRDPQPETAENEALKEFVKRIKYADEYFSSGRRDVKGRRTERGRIYIKYGPADEVISRTMEMETESYVIWHYYDSDDWFIFMDMDLSGEFYIIFSSVDNEPSEPGWQYMILPIDRDKILGEDF